MIEKYSFGSITMSGSIFSTDLKIINGQVVPEWWRKSGHVVNLEDVEDIIVSKPKFLIIGTGIGGRMKVNEKVKLELNRLGIELIEEPNAKAVEVFNRISAKGENVAAGFHITC